MPSGHGFIASEWLHPKLYGRTSANQTIVEKVKDFRGSKQTLKLKGTNGFKGGVKIVKLMCNRPFQKYLSFHGDCKHCSFKPGRYFDILH